MYRTFLGKISKFCLIGSLLTVLTQGLTQKPVDGQSLIAEISEANYSLCDQLPQSSKLTSDFQANNPQLSEAQRLNEEIQQLFNQGLYARAISVAERILLIYQKTLGDNTLEVATILTRLASLNSRVNNVEKAEAFLKEALKIRESILGADHPAVARIINGLAENYRRQKKYSESESLYERVLSIYEKHCGEHLLVVVTLNDLTILYMEQRRFEDA